MKKYFKRAFKSLKRDWSMALIVIFIIAVGFAIDFALGTAMTGISLAAGGGAIYRNSQVADGASWERLYTISSTYSALLENVTVLEADDNEKIIGWYNSSTAFATNKAQYDGLPVGSQVMDIVAGKLYMHQTATTWISTTLS